MNIFKKTAAQVRAIGLLASSAKHIMLAGGSRSGKTFIICYAIAVRAICSPGSRHAILRYRFNACKLAVALDTWPKMMALCFPEVDQTSALNKELWVFTFPNGAQVWFGGLDDKERTEKILGQEYATIFLNECSQIPYSSVGIAITRLAQVVMAKIGDDVVQLRAKMFYDENPPSQAHWSFKKFVRKIEPESGQPLTRGESYAMMYINPEDNRENLSEDYLDELRALSPRMRRRFLEGKFADVLDNALWTIESIEKARRTENLPDMVRIVIAVDPSGAGDDDDPNRKHDDIGIVVCGLGVDGRGYFLEDVTCNASPAVWGRLVASTYDRWSADLVVAEKNFGGGMVKFVVRSANSKIPFKEVVASRGKAVRAEPISALTEMDKVRFAGVFPELEDELCAMTTNGYTGENSPNRADAGIWGMSELFPGMARRDQAEENAAKREAERQSRLSRARATSAPGAWMT